MEYKGLNINTNENVYEPAEDSCLTADMVESCAKNLPMGIEVIDIGTGSGILGLVAARNGNVSRVTFCDVNDRALELAKENLKENAAVVSSKCEFVKSDLFSNISGKFDLIIFNAPYLPHENGKSNSMDWDGGKKGIALSMRLIDEAMGHMKADARIILAASSLGDLPALRSYILGKGLRIYKETSAHMFFEDIAVFLIGL